MVAIGNCCYWSYFMIVSTIFMKNHDYANPNMDDGFNDE